MRISIRKVKQSIPRHAVRHAFRFIVCPLYRDSTVVGMPNFQDTFKTRKQSFISAFSICIIAPLKAINKKK